MEALAPMPMALRSPRPKPTPVRETQKPKKDKKNRMVPVHGWPRKHFVPQTQKKDKQPEKVVDLKAEEGAKDIDAKGAESIIKLLEYIPPCKWKAKVTKDPDSEKFIIHMLLFPENITFKGSRLV